jgi:hypothetical protein
VTRARPPIDDEDLKTEIYDGGTQAEPGPSQGATVVSKPAPKRKPTMPPPIPKAPRLPDPVPVAVKQSERSEPMRAISMKTPADVATAKAPKEPKNVRPQIPQVKLRSLAEASRTTPSRGMGNLAPPRDPREARKQRLWSNTFWASIAVIIGSLVALGIWLIAGRK